MSVFDHKGRHLDRRHFCNISICQNKSVKLKVGIGSGHKVKGHKQTHAGGAGWFWLFFSRDPAQEVINSC